MLVVAGAFKRAEPDLAEDALLMRALRDFNIPKIVREDEVVFFGLLGKEAMDLKQHRNTWNVFEFEKGIRGTRYMWWTRYDGIAYLRTTTTRFSVFGTT